MWKQLTVADVKCVDDSSGTRGVRMACGDRGDTIVTLILDKAIPHEQTDELVRLLRKLKLNEVTVQTP